jgi:hypothetical protein
VQVQMEPSTERRGSLVLRASVVERSRTGGVYVSASDATVEASVVRDTLPRALDDRAGYGIELEPYDAGSVPTTLLARGSVIERSHSVGLLVASATATIESCIVRDTRPDAHEASYGRGIGFQDNPIVAIPSEGAVRWSVVDRNLDVGIVIVNSDVTIEGVAVHDTRPRQSDGLFGDGVATFAQDREASARITGCLVDNSGRAGITSFGATISVGSTRSECNPIHIDAEDSGPFVPKFVDLGGNICGCGAAGTCVLSSSGLTPPAPLGDPEL